MFLLQSLPVRLLASSSPFFWHKLRKSIPKVTQNTINRGEPTQSEWKSRNDALMWFIYPSGKWVAPSHNKVFNPPYRVELVKDIMVCHIRDHFQNEPVGAGAPPLVGGGGPPRRGNSFEKQQDYAGVKLRPNPIMIYSKTWGKQT